MKPYLLSGLRYLACILAFWLGAVANVRVLNWYVHSTLDREDWLFSWYSGVPFLLVFLGVSIPLSIAPSKRTGAIIIALLILLLEGLQIYLGAIATHLASHENKVLIERILTVHVLALLSGLWWCGIGWFGWKNESRTVRMNRPSRNKPSRTF